MRIAIVGSGIAGLGAAWQLRERHAVTLFEAGATLGGHTRTIDVTLDGVCAPVDTGFLVFNDRTYPELNALFAELGVTSANSDMSFALSVAQPDLEWAGTDVASLFAQKRNLARPAFLRMLLDIARFNRSATALARSNYAGPESLGDFLDRGGYGAGVREWYLQPMTAAIWSTPARRALDFPFATFARFFYNHGLLSVTQRPQWRTVAGGGREYVKRIAAALPDIRTHDAVVQVKRSPEDVVITTASGARSRFDHVVLACHSDQALAMLADPSDNECAVLSAIRYLPNDVVVHTDARLMPRRRAVWSAWNVLSEPGRDDSVCVSYWLDRLQPLPFSTPLFVTLNPLREPAPESVIDRCELAHPQFDDAAIRAQARLPDLQGVRRTWFCGAWTRYGFHEDGLRSATDVVRQLADRMPLAARAA